MPLGQIETFSRTLHLSCTIRLVASMPARRSSEHSRQFLVHLRLLRIGLAQPFQRTDVIGKRFLRDLKGSEVRQPTHRLIAKLGAAAGDTACGEFAVLLSICW